jgi:hypothetical protein
VATIFAEGDIMNLKPIAAVLFIAILFTASVPASRDIRIRFAKGKTSATVKGNITGGGRVCYFARARSGQLLTAAVNSRSDQVRIFESGESRYSYRIEASGGQSVCVDNLGPATNYTLTVSIR